MRLLLPEPYPDELLASVIARHQAHLGSDRWDRSLQDLFGLSRPFSNEVPANLNTLARVAGEAFAPARVIADMTLTPYYMAYQPQERVEAVMAATTRGGVGALRASGIGVSRLGRPMHLRFCRSCRDDDLSSLGETYWRRAHQLLCAQVCPKHGEPLVETRERLTREGSKILVDATVATARHPGTAVSPHHHDSVSALRLARRCDRLVKGDHGDWSRSRVADGYAPLFAERGYDLGTKEIDAERVASDMTELFGAAFLQAVGASLDYARTHSWLRVALRLKVRSLSTTEHLLVQAFLDSRPRVIGRSMIAWGGPWRCNNPHAGHDGPSISTVDPVRSRGGDRWFTARCPCGQVFTFRRTLPCAPDTPIVLRNDQIGVGWRDEVLRVKAEGLTQRVIASRSGLTVYSVAKIVAQGPGHAERRLAEVAERRSRWEAVLASIPDRSRALARKAEPNLYGLIRKTDREWLLSEPRRGPETTVGNVVNWEETDRNLAKDVETAIERLRADATSPRMTEAVMAREVGVRYQWLYHGLRAGKLPLTAAIVAPALETLRACHERKLRRVADELAQRAERLSVAKLRRAAGLERTRYGSEAYRAMYGRVLNDLDVRPD